MLWRRDKNHDGGRCSPVTAESLDEEHGGAGGINESAAERGHRQFVTDWHRVSAE
jgi:hypothetical protein